MECQTVVLAVAPKEPSHRVGMRGKIRQRFLDRDRERGTLFEGLVVGRSLLRWLPQGRKRVLIRRRRWPGIRWDASLRRRDKGRGRGTRVLPGPSVDRQHVLRGLRHAQRQERLVPCRVAAARAALRAHTPRKRRDRPTDLVAWARAAGRHLRLVATARPGRTPGAPGATLASSAHRPTPAPRVAARTIVGHGSCRHPRRWAASRGAETKRACCHDNPQWWSNGHTE